MLTFLLWGAQTFSRKIPQTSKFQFIAHTWAGINYLKASRGIVICPPQSQTEIWCIYAVSEQNLCTDLHSSRLCCQFWRVVSCQGGEGRGRKQQFTSSPNPPDHRQNQFALAESLCFQGECGGLSPNTYRQHCVTKHRQHILHAEHKHPQREEAMEFYSL